MTKTWIWTAVKWVSVLFNYISTWSVFTAALEHSVTRNILFLSPSLVIAIGVFLAILLIDFLFIALVGFLEAPIGENELYRHRKPYAIGLVMLYASIVLIGLQDEGLLALAPRVGLGIITLVAWMRYSMLSRWELDQSWEEEFQKRRYRRERKDTLKLSESQRRIKHKQQMTAIRELKGELKDKYISDFRKQLKLVEYGDEGEDDSVIIYRREPLQLSAGELEQAIEQHYNSGPEPIDENIYQYGDYYYFHSPYDGRIFYLTAQGKPYKNLAGIRRAYGRHRASYE